jgi:dipeptidyl aminopeptidase/acylaminoacyl peptidase
VYVTSLGVNPGPVALTSDAQLTFEPRSLLATKARDYSLLRWSPDGTRLLFNDNRTQTVYLAKSGEAAKELFAGTATAIPGAFSPDGKEIAYAVPAGAGDPQKNEEIYQLQALADIGAQPRVAGQITFGTGCGGGGFSPSTVLFFQETGYEGNGITLVWTARGFVHTTRCTGIGLRLTDFGGKTVWEVDNVKRVAVSPDRTRAVGIIQANMQGDPTVAGERLVLIDMATGQVSDLVNAAGIDQVAWTIDGTQAVFSTRTPIRKVSGLADNALGAALFPAWPGPFESNTLGLWVVAATGGQPTLVAVIDGYAIGAIQSIPGLNTVTFSLITSEAAAVERLNAGGREADALALRPKVVTYTAALGTGTVTPQVLIPEGGLVAFAAATQFTAVPGTPTQ